MMRACFIRSSLLSILPVLSWGSAVSSGSDWGQKKVNKEGKVVQEMKVEAPMMTEEDQYGYNMPERYRCDSCKAVVFHLNDAFKKRHPKNRRMREWEYTELFEETCGNAFDGYGVQSINGENTLSGPGLKKDKDIAPGGAMIQMGGDGWKNRIAEICRKLVNEKVGEDELYEIYHRNGRIPETMCWQEFAQCSKDPKSQKSESAKAPLSNKSGKKPVRDKTKHDKIHKLPGQAEKKHAEVSSKGIITSNGKSAINKTDPNDEMDMSTFLKSLALDDGLSPDEFSKSRTRQDWENLIVSMAGKIYNRHGK